MLLNEIYPEKCFKMVYYWSNINKNAPHILENTLIKGHMKALFQYKELCRVLNWNQREARIIFYKFVPLKCSYSIRSPVVISNEKCPFENCEILVSIPVEKGRATY